MRTELTIKSATVALGLLQKKRQPLARTRDNHSKYFLQKSRVKFTQSIITQRPGLASDFTASKGIGYNRLAMEFTWRDLILGTAIGVAVALCRYFVIYGGAFLVVWVWMKERWKRFRIQDREATSSDMRHDILWACISIVVQVAPTTWIVHEIKAGHTKVYFDALHYGWGYLFVSYLLCIAVWDAYFYFYHRLFHWKLLYKHVHVVHHKSRNPTPFTTITFHPLESLAQWIALPLIVYVFPVHIAVLGAFIFVTFIMNMLGHIGYEFYPGWFVRHPVFEWFNTSTFHNMHHSHPNSNFGLYFNFWDRFFGTREKGYLEYYGRVQSKRGA